MAITPMTFGVTVKGGLSFACPRCGRFGYRAAPGSDVFTPPTGHEVAREKDHRTIRCLSGRDPLDWHLSFADVQ